MDVTLEPRSELLLSDEGKLFEKFGIALMFFGVSREGVHEFSAGFPTGPEPCRSPEAFAINEVDAIPGLN